MNAAAANFTRAVLIFLSKNGVFRFARKGTQQHAELMDLGNGFLPCASVATLKDAEDMQIYTCKLSYDQTQYLYPLDGTLEGLDEAGRNIETIYTKWRAERRGTK